MEGTIPSHFEAKVFFAGLKGDLPRIGDCASENWDEDRAWSAWHGYLAERKEPTWFFDSASFGNVVKKHWPGLVRVWIERSERLLAGTCPAGDMVVPYVPGKGLDWSANPQRTMSALGLHYMFFLRWPIRAAMITGDGRYVRAVADCFRSYVEQMDWVRDEGNIARRGPEEGGRYAVWNSLSIGLKLKALGEGLYALRDHPEWTAEDCRNATILIWRHADFLHRKLADQSPVEWQQELNFIASGSGGLGGVGALLPEWAEAGDWLETACQVQEVLLLNQVHADGMQKELCTQYHSTVIRSLATLQMILARRGDPSFYDTEPFRTRFLEMHRLLAGILAPDGYTPSFNSAVYGTEWMAILAAGNAFFRDPELQWHLRRWYDPETVPVQKNGPGWSCTLLHDLCVPRPKGLRSRKPRSTSQLFSASGVAVLRDSWEGDGNALFLDFGHPEGGHAYAARGSFSAWVKGKPAALSPGSPFAYSNSDYKTWYYGTRGQNTVWVDEEDQELWRPGGKRRVWGRLLDWRDDRQETRVRIAHDGYLRSKGIGHERTVLLVKEKFFLICDLLDGSGSQEDHALRWTLRCPDEMREVEGGVVESAGVPGIRLVPAWTEQIEAAEIGWGPSMVPLAYREDMSPQQGQTCHVRFVQRLARGGKARFLVLMVAGDCRDAEVGGEVTRRGVEVQVRVRGEAWTGTLE